LSITGVSCTVLPPPPRPRGRTLARALCGTAVGRVDGHAHTMHRAPGLRLIEVQANLIAVETSHPGNAGDLAELLPQDGKVDSRACGERWGHDDLNDVALLTVHSVPFHLRGCATTY